MVEDRELRDGQAMRHHALEGVGRQLVDDPDLVEEAEQQRLVVGRRRRLAASGLRQDAPPVRVSAPP